MSRIRKGFAYISGRTYKVKILASGISTSIVKKDGGGKKVMLHNAFVATEKETVVENLQNHYRPGTLVQPCGYYGISGDMGTIVSTNQASANVLVGHDTKVINYSDMVVISHPKTEKELQEQADNTDEV